MSIQGIKEIDFQQAYLGKAIPRGNSKEKYIAKDFVLELGGVKIKLKASDSLRDVVRKINLKSHVHAVRAKAVKGALVLESTRKGNSQHTGITLPQRALGTGTPLNANQIIAQYLASVPPKVSVPRRAELLMGLSIINEVDELLEDDLGNAVLGVINEVDEADEISSNSSSEVSVYEEANEIIF